MLFPSAARAGHWSLTASGSCTGTINGQPATSPVWNPPSGASTNSISFSSYEIAAAAYGYPQYQSVGNGSVQYTILATVTGTWVADSTSDNTPPPSVVLQETSGAYYKTISGSGSPAASDGLTPADPVVPSSDSTYSAIGTSSSVAPHFVTKTGSPWTVSFTITASASASSATGFCKADVGFSGLTVSIHAQPYGWYDCGYDADLYGGPDNTGGPKIDTPSGTLKFRYRWKSTDGNIKSLSSSKLIMYERVDYTGNPGTFRTDSTGTYYRPPSPPIGLDLTHASPQPFEVGNPTFKIVTATDGVAYDEHSAWPTQTPYSVLTVVAPQLYEFNDDATNEISIVLFDPGSINEGIKLNPNIFYVRKSGYYVAKPLP